MAHYIAVVIRAAGISLVKAHEYMGERLVEKSIADYYDSTGRNQVAWPNGSTSIELKTFMSLMDINNNVQGVGSVFDFCILDGKDDDIQEEIVVHPSSFFEYHSATDLMLTDLRHKLLYAQSAAFKRLLNTMLKDMLKDNKRYLISKLDYHY